MAKCKELARQKERKLLSDKEHVEKEIESVKQSRQQIAHMNCGLKCKVNVQYVGCSYLDMMSVVVCMLMAAYNVVSTVC